MRLKKIKKALFKESREIDLIEFYNEKSKKYFNEISKKIDEKMGPYISNIEDLKEISKRLVDDLRKSKFNEPDIHPTKKEIKEKGNEIDLVISCRGEDRKIIDPSIVYTIPKDILKGYEDCKNKKIIIYVHGYNVNSKIALEEANDIFLKFKRSLKKKKEPLSDYKFILFTWPGDAGLINFSRSQIFAEYSGKALHRFFLELVDEIKVKEINIIAHSLGSHVVLKSASLIEKDKKNYSYKNVLFLGPAIEEDVLIEEDMENGYHYPKSLEAIKTLNIVTSKSDIALEFFFTLNELKKPLGSSVDIYKGISKIKVHDFTPSSLKKREEKYYVNSHLKYWENQEQVDLYMNFICD
jgi:predicted alpha/beta hydrolase family esterase